MHSKWLRTRATAWGIVFRILESKGIVSRAIHSEQNNLNPVIYGYNTLWIISSVIQPKLRPFSYSKVRSVFPPETRFIQTKNTIASIKSISDKALIVVVEGSKYAGIDELVDENVLVFQLKSNILRFVVNGPFKGLGEAILLLLIRPKAKSTTYVRKISGRYIVNEVIEKKPILFREQSASAISISYGMTLDVFEHWQKYLEINLTVLSKGISMEQLLYDFTRRHSFDGSPILGVSGQVAVTGGETKV